MKTARLGDLADLIRGITYKPSDCCDYREPGAFACMRTKNVQAYLDESDIVGIARSVFRSEEKIINEGDILVSSANSWNLVGKCCWVPKLTYPATAGGFISILRSKSRELNPRFLYRWFSSAPIQAELRSFGNQTTNISNLDHKRSLALEIPLPPLAEQKRIAAILDAADALRTKRREALAQLDALLQSTFLTLFGEPLIGKIGDAQSVEFGKLTSRITYGFTCPMDHVPNGIPIITAKNVRHGFLDFDNCHHATEIQFEKLTDKCKPEKGDLLITKDGAIRGRCAIVNTRSRFCISQAVALIRPDPASVIPEYLWGYIVSTRIQRKIMDMDKGVAMPHLQITELAKFPVELPPLPLQQKFAAIVESIERQKAAQRAHLAELDALFAALQHRAFRGEL